MNQMKAYPTLLGKCLDQWLIETIIRSSAIVVPVALAIAVLPIHDRCALNN